MFDELRKRYENYRPRPIEYENDWVNSGLLCDREIRRLALHQGMISPFAEHSPQGGISFGLSSYGYDIRVADEFKVFKESEQTVIDPKNFSESSYEDKKGLVCIIPPNSFALAKSVEYLKIPRDILVLCVGKSTYARCGQILPLTPLEPEWEGIITLEISNTTPLPAKIYANEGIAQLLFFRADRQCETSYADRKGKYQRQTGITLPRK